MLDFKNANYLKLKLVGNEELQDMLGPMLLDGESIHSTYKSVRDGVVFTNKRIIAVNIQGFTGLKKSFVSLPYSKIQLFSVDTAGIQDPDCVLELWFAGAGMVKFEFIANADVKAISKTIGEYVL